jgi:hypothetical protein
VREKIPLQQAVTAVKTETAEVGNVV